MPEPSRVTFADQVETERDAAQPITLPPPIYLTECIDPALELGEDFGIDPADAYYLPLEEDEEEGRDAFGVEDVVLERIKADISKNLQRTESESSLSTITGEEEEVGQHVKQSDRYTLVPYGIQPKATYTHGKKNADIMGLVYNGKNRMFVILDGKGLTSWRRDITLDARIQRVLMYPKYEYRLISYIIYARKYDCYFALGKDFSLKVLNRDFLEICSVSADLRSVLFMLFNPAGDELITGGVGGTKIWEFKQDSSVAFTELKQLANYRLKHKRDLKDVGGSWVKRVDLDHSLQHLYCCSDTDLYIYDLSSTGKLLFKYERAHNMSITGCCYSQFAKCLATCSVDTEVKIWSLQGTIAPVHTFRGHSRAVTSLIMHPDTSSIIITASMDGSVRMWSLVTMEPLYSNVISSDGVLWMGLTDDNMLYCSTVRAITLWSINQFYSFYAVARTHLTKLSLASCEGKTTRVVAEGEDSSVRLFSRQNQKNLTTVLPPPNISPLEKIVSVCYSREFDVVFVLINTKEIWVYTTRTDPSCRVAVWNVHELQSPYLTTKKGKDKDDPLGGWSTSLQGGLSHRATENGLGNELTADCHSLCILNSTASMWTDEGFCCPIRHTYLLMGLEDGRILFMDPVVAGKKHMEFKAYKDAIKEMKHDVAHESLITLCMLKSLAFIQIWSLPHLALQHEIYCAVDLTCYARLGGLFLTGHFNGQVNTHKLEPAEDWGILKAKGEPKVEEVVKEVKPEQREHFADVVALDSSATMKIFSSCSSNGVIRIWDENRLLLTEIFLDESLSAACFLNEKADLIVGFKNHIFFIPHTKVCPHLPETEVQEDQYRESPILEDPSVLYEGGVFLPEPVTMENYLVPFPNIEFSKDFLEGNVDLEPEESSDESSDTESQFTPAPSDIYRSPLDSPDSLSKVDLLLDSSINKHDLRKQMKATMGLLRKRVQEARREKAERKNRILRRRMRFLGLLKKSPKQKKQVSIADQESASEKEEEEEELKFDMPHFGESPGPTPPPTPPSHPATPEPVPVHEEPEEEKPVLKDDDYKPPEEDTNELFGHLPPEPDIEYIPYHIDPRKPPSAKLSSLKYPDSDKLKPQSPHVKPREPSPTLTSQHPSPLPSRPTSPFPNQPQTPDTLMSEQSIFSSDVQSNQLSRSSVYGRTVPETKQETLKEPEKPAPKMEVPEIELPRRSKYGLAHIKVDVKGLMKEQKKKIVKPPRRKDPSPARSDHTHTKAPEDNQLLTAEELARKNAEEDKRLERMKKQMLKERKFPKRADKPTRAQLLAEQKRQEELKKQHPYGIAPDIKLNLDKKDKQKQNGEQTDQLGDMPMIRYDDMETFEDDIWNDAPDTGVSKSGLMGTKLDLPPKKPLPGKGKLTIIQPPSRPQSRAQGGLTTPVGTEGPIVVPTPTLDLELGKKEEVEKSMEEMRNTEKLQGRVTPLKGIKEEQPRGGATPDIETAVQRQWTNGAAIERPRSETPSTALKKLSDSRKQKPITIVLPKESDGKLDTHRDTPMPDIAEEKSQHSGQEADDELTDDDKKRRQRRHGHGHSAADKEASLLTMEEKKFAQQRPYSSFVRRTTPATGSDVQRPKTAHVKFQSELDLLLEIPDNLEDLQSAFEEALDRFHKLHGDSSKTEQEREKLLHKNDGTEFEYNWQERVIERHMLLRMQKILRSRSAAMRRKAWEEQLEEKRQKLYQGPKEADSQSAVAMTTRSDSCMYVLNQVERANTFLTGPVTSESRQSVRLPRRPKTAAANLQRQQLEKEVLKTEKPFRHKITQRLSSQQSSRTFSQSRDSEMPIDPRILDPRNPYCFRPHTSKSIPSKCSRYVLISKPKHKSSVPLPTPLEEHLLAERFPQQGMKVYQHHTDLAAKAKKLTYTIEYTPFTHPIS